MITDRYIAPGEPGFKGSLLDDYLAAGYYRMQHIIFTTHNTQLDIDQQPVPVFWLRTAVNTIKENKAAIAIRKKCRGFQVTYKKAAITEELEALYAVYRSYVNFSTSATCAAYLHQVEIENPFDSWMIEVRDNDALVAAGFFDLGKIAMSGIINFYHPNYNKFSPGKFLILKKIDYALENDIHYYYTGYISTAIGKFDYKLFPDPAAIEVYLPVERVWIPYSLAGKAALEAYFLKFIKQQPG